MNQGDLLFMCELVRIANDPCRKAELTDKETINRVIEISSKYSNQVVAQTINDIREGVYEH